jgi:hypothetical protein
MLTCDEESPSRYRVTFTVARDGGQLPDPVTLQRAASQAASPASPAPCTAGTSTGIDTVYAPDRYAAVAAAPAVVSDALKHQALSPSQPAIPAAQRLKNVIA